MAKSITVGEGATAVTYAVGDKVIFQDGGVDTMCTVTVLDDGRKKLQIDAADNKMLGKEEIEKQLRLATSGDRVFQPAVAKGGVEIAPEKTALVLIEFQNEFATEGGKLHDVVKDCMKANDMLAKTAKLVEGARAKGVKIFHTPITFTKDMSDNPNKGFGILKNCKDGEAFLEGTWNAEIVKEISQKEGDIHVKGKHGLDAFPGTTLQQELTSNGIETVAIAGFLTNCCCESTMRTAYEKGYNVVTLTDCMAAGMDGHKAATEGTFGMFSSPMTCAEFTSKIGL